MTSSTKQYAQIANLDERYAKLRLMEPGQLSWMRESVEQHGVLSPLLVNAAEDGGMQVLDGFKRLAVLREREEQKAWIRLVHLPEAAAVAAILTYNAANRGVLKEIEEGWLVHALVRTQGLAQKEAAKLLGRHKSWVCRRLLLVEQLCDSVQEDMRLGLVSPTVARELARLPRGNQAEVAQSVREHELTSRQAQKLCAVYLSSEIDENSAETLEEVLRDPLRFLERFGSKTKREQKDPRLSRSGEEMRRRLVRFDRAVADVQWILNKYPISNLRLQDHEILAPMGAGIGDRGQKVVDRLTELAQTSEKRRKRRPKRRASKQGVTSEAAQ